jgi:hypothetical protein
MAAAVNWWLWLFLALAAIAGVGCIVALVGRARREPACPRCGHLRTPNAPERDPCVECGLRPTPGAERRTWRRRRRAPVFAFAAGLACVVCTFVAVRPYITPWLRRTFLPQWRTEWSGMAAGHRVRIELDATNEIDRRVVVAAPTGDVVLRLNAFRPEVGAGGSVNSTLPVDDSPGFGGDVDGDGAPDLVIRDPNIGSGGGGTTFIYRLDPNGATPTYVGEATMLRPTADGKAYELVAGDRAFSYRWTSNAGSPRPLVVLRPIGGQWRPSKDAMRVNAPDAQAVAAASEAIRSAAEANGDAYFGPLLKIVVGRLYAGDSVGARTFLHEHWRGDAASLKAFEREFSGAFRSSPWAAEVREFSASDTENLWP